MANTNTHFNTLTNAISSVRSAFKILVGEPTGKRLTTNREVAGSIPGSSTILNVD